MEIKALKAFTIRDSETGNLTSIAHGAIAEVSSTLGESFIADGLAEEYASVHASFKAIVDDSLTKVTADMLDGVKTISQYAFYECAVLKSVELPNSVTSIANYAFSNCSALESITIPASVVSIGKGAFENCSSLESITIPNTVTSIENGTFSRCSALVSVTIPNSVTTIGMYPFQYCAFTSVTIPESVTTIGIQAFNKCANLTSVTVLNPTPPTTAVGIFDSTPDSLVIYVPAESVDAYKATNYWSNYADRIQAIPNE